MGKTKIKSDEILTVSQAAVFLQVEEDVLRSETQAGRVPARQIAGDYRYSRRAILRWIRAGRIGSDTAKSMPFFEKSDLRTTTTTSPVAPRTESASVPAESIDEQEAFLEILRAQKDEIDRSTKSGRYAEE